MAISGNFGIDGDGNLNYLKSKQVGFEAAPKKIDVDFKTPDVEPKTNDYGDALLTDTTAAWLGAQFSTKPKLFSPAEHPEVMALHKQQMVAMGLKPVDPAKAAEINKTADLAYATKTMPNLNKGLEAEISDTEQRMENLLKRLDIEFGIN